MCCPEGSDVNRVFRKKVFQAYGSSLFRIESRRSELSVLYPCQACGNLQLLNATSSPSKDAEEENSTGQTARPLSPRKHIRLGYQVLLAGISKVHRMIQVNLSGSSLSA